MIIFLRELYIISCPIRSVNRKNTKLMIMKITVTIPKQYNSLRNIGLSSQEGLKIKLALISITGESGFSLKES